MVYTMYSVMITIEADFCNPISQDFYVKIIHSLSLNQITCTCGHTGSLIWYGAYSRRVRMADQVILLRVARVFCSSCGHTHALLLSSIVRSYRRHWKERLRSHSLSLLSLSDLIDRCFSFFSRPFMQIKTTPNKLFLLPT